MITFFYLLCFLFIYSFILAFIVCKNQKRNGSLYDYLISFFIPLPSSSVKLNLFLGRTSVSIAKAMNIKQYGSMANYLEVQNVGVWTLWIICSSEVIVIFVTWERYNYHHLSFRASSQTLIDKGTDRPDGGLTL